jgi:hypothetical protein
MKSKAILILFLAISILGFSRWRLEAQDDAARKAATKMQFPLEISFINHAVTLPFDGIVLSPIHPGFSLGSEFAWKEGRLGRLFQNFQAGYFYNEFNAKGLFLQTGIGFRHTFRFNLFAEVQAGLGYLHSFHPRQIYEMGADGEWEKARNGGKSSAIFSVAFGIGYDFIRILGRHVSLFLRFQPFLQTPYCEEDSILPQSFMHFGIRFKLW